MELISIDNHTKEIMPSAMALAIPAFANIWERDKTKGKATAMKEIALAYFMTSLEADNPYWEIPDATERRKSIIADLFEKGYKPDQKVYDLEETLDGYYKNTFSYNYYKKSLDAAQRLLKYLETADFDERTKTGGMIHDPKKVQDLIKNTRQTLKELSELRTAVINESYDQDRMVSDRKRLYFED